LPGIGAVSRPCPQMREIAAMRFLAVLLALGLALSTAALAQTPTTRQAIFAGGCFWCMEPPYDKMDGVISTTSGYSGGEEPNPTYAEVSAGKTGHYEVVRVEYDPAKVGYQQLLDVFWKNIDPLDAKGQFCDKGDHYRAAIFYSNEEEKALAEQSKGVIQSGKGFKEPVVTEILPAKVFHPAEDYHQDYYQKNPLKYKFYRFNCGRDARLDAVWGPDREKPGH
jgi:peptide-methionine (S)-S-oxide reductase